MSLATSPAKTGPATGTDRLDPRGPQFNAAVTSVVLIAVLLLAPRPIGVALLVIQTALFAIGVVRGVAHTPLAWVFRTFVRPRLAPPSDWEDPRPPRFAQGVGLVFALVALGGFVSGATTLGLVAAGFALAAALLNAVFRLCLGCEMYVVLLRAGVIRHA